MEWVGEISIKSKMDVQNDPSRNLELGYAFRYDFDVFGLYRLVFGKRDITFRFANFFDTL